MRLEFNPRALCYNLYCDTREEHEKLKQMVEKMTTNINTLSNIIYSDTDSVTPLTTDEVKYIKNDVSATKNI